MEIDRTQKVKCPCGKGYIEYDCLSDDWGHYEQSTPIIKCEICKK